MKYIVVTESFLLQGVLQQRCSPRLANRSFGKRVGALCISMFQRDFEVMFGH